MSVCEMSAARVTAESRVKGGCLHFEHLKRKYKKKKKKAVLMLQMISEGEKVCVNP